MHRQQDVLRILDHALQLQGRALGFAPDTPLLGALPEFDSMAVLALISGLEQHYGITFSDEALTGASFANVASLCQLVDHALAPSTP